MKKIVPAAAALLLTLAACAPKEAETTATPAATPAATATMPNIRYIDVDSIMHSYTLALQYQALMEETAKKIENAAQARQAEIQKLGTQIEQKGRNNGYLTQESYEADMQRFAKMQQDAEVTLANMQRQAQQQMAIRQMEVADSLQSYVTFYNARKGYDMILFKEAGVYFNPALDITADIIKGMNERYDKSQKK